MGETARSVRASSALARSSRLRSASSRGSAALDLGAVGVRNQPRGSSPKPGLIAAEPIGVAAVRQGWADRLQTVEKTAFPKAKAPVFPPGPRYRLGLYAAILDQKLIWIVERRFSGSLTPSPVATARSASPFQSTARAAGRSVLSRFRRHRLGLRDQHELVKREVDDEFPGLRPAAEAAGARVKTARGALSRGCWRPVRRARRRAWRPTACASLLAATGRRPTRSLGRWVRPSV